MDLLIKTLGYLALAVIILLIIGFFAARYFWGKLKDLAKLGEPIELIEDKNPTWISKPKIKSVIADFEAIGFKPNHTYEPLAMGISPMILTNDARDQFGEIYFVNNEVITGFSTDTVEGMSLNVTTTELADTFGLKPDKVTEGYPGASVAELYEKFKVMIEGHPLERIPDETFTKHFQKQLNKEFHGMYDSHEKPLWQDGETVFIERWSKHHKKEKNLVSTYEMMVGEHINSIESTVSEQLGEREDISAALYSKYEYNFLLFNPRFHKNGYRDYLDETFTCRDEVKTKRLKQLAEESQDTTAFFERFRQEYPQLQLEKFTSVTEPIESDLWGYHDPDDDDEED